MVGEKMKIKNIKWIICGVIVIVIGGLIVLLGIDKVNTSKMSNGMVRFVYMDKNISKQLDGGDACFVKEMFNGKWLYKDNPSCGFSDNVSVSFDNGDNIFCIAQDSCPIIYDKSKNKYFKVSEEGILELHEILEKYGFVFPCV